MRTRFSRWAGSLIALSLPAWAGCFKVPPGRINADRMDFGQVIQESWKRQTLLNIVQMRYADAPMFLDVASVINSYSLGGSVSGGASLQKEPSADSVALGAAGHWSNTPTVTYQPLMGERFTRSLLQPVAPAGIFQLMQGGPSPELVMTTLVRSINGLRNDSFGVAGDPGFRELVGALARINNNYHRLHPKARAVAVLFDLAPVCYNPFMNNVSEAASYTVTLTPSMGVVPSLRVTFPESDPFAT